MSYQTLAELKNALQITSTDSPRDVRLQRMLDIASRKLTNKCQCYFGLVTATQYYDAPPLPELTLADLQTVTLLKRGATTLSSGTDYQVLGYTNNPASPSTTQLRYLVSGQRTNWDTGLDETTRYKALTVTGQWGYDSAPPPEIVEACETIAVRLWRARLAQHGEAEGNSILGESSPPDLIWTDYVMALICDYIRPAGPRPLALV